MLLRDYSGQKVFRTTPKHPACFSVGETIDGSREIMNACDHFVTREKDSDVIQHPQITQPFVVSVSFIAAFTVIDASHHGQSKLNSVPRHILFEPTTATGIWTAVIPMGWESAVSRT